MMHNLTLSVAIGLVAEALSGGPESYMHDGRARTLEEAILWHEGESKQAKESYKKLNKSDREKVFEEDLHFK